MSSHENGPLEGMDFHTAITLAAARLDTTRVDAFRGTGRRVPQVSTDLPRGFGAGVAEQAGARGVDSTQAQGAGPEVTSPLSGAPTRRRGAEQPGLPQPARPAQRRTLPR